MEERHEWSDVVAAIDELSVVGRQCVAVICLERFCREYQLDHPAIAEFVDHVWKVAQVDPGSWTEWERGFHSIPLTGQGATYPGTLVEAIPEDLRDDFFLLTQSVFWTSAETWYGYDLEGTKSHLLQVLKISSRHNIAIPDLRFYINPPVEHHDHWGPPLSDEQLREWRNTA